MVFLKLRQEPGEYSRVTVGMAIRNWSLFSDVRTLSSYDGHLRNLNWAWQDNTDASGCVAGDRVSVSRWNSDIGIPIHFQEESGIVIF